jgi:hypothetical protein
MSRKTVVIIFFIVKIVSGQLSVSNLFEYQVGNLPLETPSNLTTHYDQLNIGYRYSDFVFSAKLEHFQNPNSDQSYTHLAQRSLSFKKDGLKIKVGNFYQIFGRGLVLRTYEIPGAVREDFSFRSRYGFYRDIDGFWAGYETSWFELTALRGKPLREELPPVVPKDEHRVNLVEGTQLNLYVSDFTLTGIYLRNTREEEYHEYASFGLAANLPLNIQFYGEYARKLGGETEFFDLSDNSAHGLYLSMNMVMGSAGFTAEVKDYNNLLLGFNDPPPLVKEHEYLLLNRSTHSSEPLNETGWQTEFFYTLKGGHTLIANMSETINESPFRRFVSKEKFVEIGIHFLDQMTIKGFADLGREDLRLQKDRYTYGIYVENGWFESWGTTIDIEYQNYLRGLISYRKIENYAAQFALSYAPDLSVGILYEFTTDPGEVFKDWIGYNLSYQYSQHHLISMFYGKRRGGNVCIAGICYQVLPFEGFEFRLTSTL